MGWDARYIIILKPQKDAKIAEDITSQIQFCEKCDCCDDIMFYVDKKYGQLWYLKKLMALVSHLVDGKFVTITGKYSGNADRWYEEPPTTLLVKDVSELDQDVLQEIRKTFEEIIKNKLEEETKGQIVKENAKKSAAKFLSEVKRKLEKMTGVSSIDQYVMQNLKEREYSEIDKMLDSEEYNGICRFIIYFLSILK